jgi:hypothetical protein
MSRHPVVVGGAVLALAATVGGLGAVMIWRHQQLKRPAVRAKHLRTAVARMIAHPDRVAQGEPAMYQKLLAAAGTALVGALTKQLIARSFQAPRGGNSRVLPPVSTHRPLAHA